MRDDSTYANPRQADWSDPDYRHRRLTPLRIPDWHSELDEAHAENHKLKSEIRLLTLELAEVRRSPSNGHGAPAPELAEKDRVIQSQRRELEALRAATRAAPAQSATPVRVIRKEG